MMITRSFKLNKEAEKNLNELEEYSNLGGAKIINILLTETVHQSGKDFGKLHSILILLQHLKEKALYSQKPPNEDDSVWEYTAEDLTS